MQIPAKPDIGVEISFPCAIRSTLTIHRWWEDEMARYRTGHPPSYAKAKKMMMLTLLAYVGLRASLMEGHR